MDDNLTRSLTSYVEASVRLVDLSVPHCMHVCVFESATPHGRDIITQSNFAGQYKICFKL